jgi:hypothetical protein
MVKPQNRGSSSAPDSAIREFYPVLECELGGFSDPCNESLQLVAAQAGLLTFVNLKC